MEVMRYLFKENGHLQEWRTALARVKWAGRMEEILPKVYVDGAHNVSAIQAFARSVPKNPDGNIILFSAVKDKEYFAETTRKIVETRDWAEEEFKKLGFVFPKPSANFIFVSHPEYDAKELFEAMKAKGIYVRFWGSERIEQYLRVTIGTREEMEALFAFLREYMM